MRKIAKALLAGTVLFASRGNAANSLDQNQAIIYTTIASLNTPDLAQSFQQSAGNISGAGIYLQDGYGSTGDVSISLWDALPNVAGAMKLASGSAQGSPASWADVFWSPVSISSGQTYYLVFSGTNYLAAAGSRYSVYDSGIAYGNEGFTPYPSADFAFRTYAADQLGAIPEPVTWALLIIGFGAIGGALRRSKPEMVLSYC